MNISGADLLAQYRAAAPLWPIISVVEREFELPAFLLWAEASKETGMNRAYAEGKVHNDGHGWGLFGADDRWNKLDLPHFASDPEEQSRLAARTLRANYKRLGNWLDAVNAYGPAAGRPAYGHDVLERADFLATHADTGEPMDPADIIALAMADPVLSGVDVVYVDGWRDRGRPGTFRPQGCVIHHTATSRRAPGDYPSLGIVRDGLPDLAGPLSQFGLGRSGAVYVIAAGKANHAGPGGWRGLSGNGTVWGIEWESDGIGEPITPGALDAYPRLVAALARHTPFDPSMIACHREWSEYKIDPTGIDGDWFRARVAELLDDSGSIPEPPPEPQEVPTMFVFDGPQGGIYYTDGDKKWGVPSQESLDFFFFNPALGGRVPHLGTAPQKVFDELRDRRADEGGVGTPMPGTLADVVPPLDCVDA